MSLGWSSSPDLGRVLKALVLLGAVLLAYSPVLRAGFVWDDDMYIVNNELLRSWQGLARIWTNSLALDNLSLPVGEPEISPGRDARPQGGASKYIDYPLTVTSYWVDWQLWKLDPLPYHLINVLLHGLNSILLWVVLGRLGIAGGFAAAAIFALHPLYVESVAWIAERKTLLSTTFSFTAILSWLRFLATSERKALWASLLVGLLAMLSKISMITLPCVLLLLTWWRAPNRLREGFWRLVPLGLAAVALVSATLWREHAGYAYVPEDDGVARGLLIAGRAAWFYVGKLLWPFPLMPIYPRWPINVRAAAQYLYPTTFLATLLLLWKLRDRLGRAPFAAVGIYFLTILPTLGIVRFDYLRLSYVADHFAYPATAALIALASGVAFRSGGRVRPHVKGMLALCLCLVLALLTALQCRIFENGLSFWAHASRYNPESQASSLNLASQLFSRGRGPDAEQVARTALARSPTDASLHNILGASLGIQRKLEASEAEFRVALQLSPGFTDARLNLGLSLFRQERWNEAIEQLQLIPERDPGRLRPLRYIGLAYQQLGDREQAIRSLQSALLIDPGDAASLKALQELQSSGSR